MKIGIIGTGFIIREALEAMSEVPLIGRKAIFARPGSVEKGRSFAEEFGIEKVYTDYDALLADPDIDTVYVANINRVHYEYGKKALLAGKDVIMEKPFTALFAQAQELADLAESRERLLFEAVTSRNCPVLEKMRELLPRLGRLRMIQANFSQYSRRYDRYLQGETIPAFDPASCGGALYDLNVYNFNVAVALLGEPLDVQYLPNPGYNGIDTSGIAALRYGDFVGVLSAAKDSDSPSHFTIQGEKGWIQVPGKTNEMGLLRWEIEKRRGEFVPPPDKNRMVQEFCNFSLAASKKDFAFAKREMETTLSVMRAIEKARLSAGIHFPTDA